MDSDPIDATVRQDNLKRLLYYSCAAETIPYSMYTCTRCLDSGDYTTVMLLSDSYRPQPPHVARLSDQWHRHSPI